MHYFSRFFTKFKKPGVNYFRVWMKRQLIGNFEKTFENVENISEENCEKCIILAYISKEFNTPCVYIFCAFGRKRQFIGKFEKIFENVENIS